MDILKRSVFIEDSDLILEWRNSVDARRSSQNPEEITQKEHEIWMRSRILRTPNEPFWIMSLNENYIGYVRLDLLSKTRDTFNVSIFVVPECRNAGIGNRMLSLALDCAALKFPNSIFRAVIKNDNFRSIGLFERLGFMRQEEIDSKFTEYRLTAKEVR